MVDTPFENVTKFKEWLETKKNAAEEAAKAGYQKLIGNAQAIFDKAKEHGGIVLTESGELRITQAAQGALNSLTEGAKEAYDFLGKQMANGRKLLTVVAPGGDDKPFMEQAWDWIKTNKGMLLGGLVTLIGGSLFGGEGGMGGGMMMLMVVAVMALASYLFDGSNGVLGSLMGLPKTNQDSPPVVQPQVALGQTQGAAIAVTTNQNGSKSITVNGKPIADGSNVDLAERNISIVVTGADGQPTDMVSGVLSANGDLSVTRIRSAQVQNGQRAWAAPAAAANGQNIVINILNGQDPTAALAPLRAQSLATFQPNSNSRHTVSYDPLDLENVNSYTVDLGERQVAGTNEKVRVIAHGTFTAGANGAPGTIALTSATLERDDKAITGADGKPLIIDLATLPPNARTISYAADAQQSSINQAQRYALTDHVMSAAAASLAALRAPQTQQTPAPPQAPAPQPSPQAPIPAPPPGLETAKLFDIEKARQGMESTAILRQISARLRLATLTIISGIDKNRISNVPDIRTLKQVVVVTDGHGTKTIIKGAYEGEGQSRVFRAEAMLQEANGGFVWKELRAKPGKTLDFPVSEDGKLTQRGVKKMLSLSEHFMLADARAPGTAPDERLAQLANEALNPRRPAPDNSPRDVAPDELSALNRPSTPPVADDALTRANAPRI